jgi:hypothetical protein
MKNVKFIGILCGKMPSEIAWLGISYPNDFIIAAFIYQVSLSSQ